MTFPYSCDFPALVFLKHKSNILPMIVAFSNFSGLVSAGPKIRVKAGIKEFLSNEHFNRHGVA